MEHKVIQFIEQRQLIEQDKTVVVGLSGGPDSLALTHFLNKWRAKWRLRVTAVIVNHQLRGKQADEDVQFVRHFCHSWSIPLIVKTINVKEYKETNKISTQVAARELRYEAFKEAIDELQADYLALGHHGDDQVETMTMQLIRSAHLEGMLGIPYERSFHTGKIIRPLLAVTKADIETYCSQHQLTPRIDESNESMAYTRNFIRKKIVPHLKEINEHVHQTVQQLTESLQEDEAFMRREATKLFDALVSKHDKRREAEIVIPELKKHPVSLQRRVFRLTLDYLYGQHLPQLHYNHENILLSLLKDDVANKKLNFPEHLYVEKEYDKLMFYFQTGRATPFLANVQSLPATVLLPDSSKLIMTKVDEWIDEQDENMYICSESQIDFPLSIRTRSPGDRIRYKGLKGSKKLKDIFIDEKIPRRKRDEMIIISDYNDEILWVIGVRKGLLKRRGGRGPYILFRYENNFEEDIDA